jgi:hypothetical protein
MPAGLHHRVCYALLGRPAGDGWVDRFFGMMPGSGLSVRDGGQKTVSNGCGRVYNKVCKDVTKHWSLARENC